MGRLSRQACLKVWEQESREHPNAKSAPLLWARPDDLKSTPLLGQLKEHSIVEHIWGASNSVLGACSDSLEQQSLSKLDQTVQFATVNARSNSPGVDSPNNITEMPIPSEASADWRTERQTTWDSDSYSPEEWLQSFLEQQAEHTNLATANARGVDSQSNITETPISSEASADCGTKRQATWDSDSNSSEEWLQSVLEQAAEDTNLSSAPSDWLEQEGTLGDWSPPEVSS